MLSERSSLVRGGSQHAVLQLTTQLHVHRLKLLFDYKVTSVFPVGIASEALEVGPVPDSSSPNGPCLLMLTHVALSPQELNDWLMDVCLDWAVQRVFWIPAMPVGSITKAVAAMPAGDGSQVPAVQGHSSQPLPDSVHVVTGLDALLAAAKAVCLGSSQQQYGASGASTASGLSSVGGLPLRGVRLQVWPKTQESRIADLLRDVGHLPLDLDRPSHTLHIIRWPCARAQAAQAALAAAVEQHARIGRDYERSQGRAAALADQLALLAQHAAGAGESDAKTTVSASGTPISVHSPAVVKKASATATQGHSQASRWHTQSKIPAPLAFDETDAIPPPAHQRHYLRSKITSPLPQEKKDMGSSLNASSSQAIDAAGSARNDHAAHAQSPPAPASAEPPAAASAAGPLKSSNSTKPARQGPGDALHSGACMLDYNLSRGLGIDPRDAAAAAAGPQGQQLTVSAAVAGIADAGERARVAEERSALERHRAEVRGSRRCGLVSRLHAERAELAAQLQAAEVVLTYSLGLCPAHGTYIHASDRGKKVPGQLCRAAAKLREALLVSGLWQPPRCAALLAAGPGCTADMQQQTRSGETVATISSNCSSSSCSNTAGGSGCIGGIHGTIHVNGSVSIGGSRDGKAALAPGLVPGLVAIDVGSAPGGWTQTLAACGARRVIAIDPADMDVSVLAEHPHVVRHIPSKVQDACSSGRLEALLQEAACDMGQQGHGSSSRGLEPSRGHSTGQGAASWLKWVADSAPALAAGALTGMGAALALHALLVPSGAAGGSAGAQGSVLSTMLVGAAGVAVGAAAGALSLQSQGPAALAAAQQEQSVRSAGQQSSVGVLIAPWDQPGPKLIAPWDMPTQVTDGSDSRPQQQQQQAVQAHLVVCDVNAHPNDAVAMLRPVLEHLMPGGLLVLTLKTFGRGKGKSVWEGELARLLGPEGFEQGMLYWLLANTPCERTYIARKRGEGVAGAVHLLA